jgi:hypothetical protein
MTAAKPRRPPPRGESAITYQERVLAHRRELLELAGQPGAADELRARADTLLRLYGLPLSERHGKPLAQLVVMVDCRASIPNQARLEIFGAWQALRMRAMTDDKLRAELDKGTTTTNHVAGWVLS